MISGVGQAVPGTLLAVTLLVAGCGAPPEPPDQPDAPPAALAGDSSIDTIRDVVSAPVPEVADGPSDVFAARDTLEAYYAAIGAGRYPEAYRFWSHGGEASGQTEEEFAAGYAETTSVGVTIGAGTIEGAVGSRYAEFPVEIRATTSNGTDQHFVGSYVLRRSVVDGATAEQQAWRIYSADVELLP